MSRGSRGGRARRERQPQQDEKPRTIYEKSQAQRHRSTEGAGDYWSLPVIAGPDRAPVEVRRIRNGDLLGWVKILNLPKSPQGEALVKCLCGTALLARMEWLAGGQMRSCGLLNGEHHPGRWKGDQVIPSTPLRRFDSNYDRQQNAA